MLRASKLGMCNGDFQFLFVGQASPPEKVYWSYGNSNDALLREAFKHVIYVRQLLASLIIDIIMTSPEWIDVLFSCCPSSSVVVRIRPWSSVTQV